MFSCSVEQPVIISNSTAVKSPVWEDRCSATVTPLCGWNPIHVNKVEKDVINLESTKSFRFFLLQVMLCETLLDDFIATFEKRFLIPHIM